MANALEASAQFTTSDILPVVTANRGLGRQRPGASNHRFRSRGVPL